MSENKRVTGIGGIFFKSKNRESLLDWYKTHLGLNIESWGGSVFKWRDQENPDKEKYSVFSVFNHDTDYLDPSKSPFMINFRVDDLKTVVEELKKENQNVTEIDEHPEGLFAWIIDPDGNKIELWQEL
ncbi:MAG: VOC family protein [Ignavibacteriae bacterium]|jgi:predicted enzyme related to lactoylglutathione lyase|nr:VOC family protein [Ignavibacteriota bacterium]NOG99157.1 VOC family protein [Ignavibacteriota bacterium]